MKRIIRTVVLVLAGALSCSKPVVVSGNEATSLMEKSESDDIPVINLVDDQELFLCSKREEAPLVPTYFNELHLLSLEDSLVHNTQVHRISNDFKHELRSRELSEIKRSQEERVRKVVKQLEKRKRLQEKREREEEARITRLSKENRWGIVLTTEEKHLLARIVYLESRGEDMKGQEMVVEVIFNRMKDDYFKGSLTSVLSRNRQFCTWSNRHNGKVEEAQLQVIENVLSGRTSHLPRSYVYFATYKANGRDFIKHGCHYFGR